MKPKEATEGRPFIIGLGEVLWDLLPAGKLLGGAPANFAYHALALGAEALMVSRVGNDALGREILDRLSGLGLRTDGIRTDSFAPTGTVAGHEPERIIEFAHLVADYVCTQAGATPPMPAHLRHHFVSRRAVR
jgi:sugar/nucleoside kinase (ribokinase family)